MESTGVYWIAPFQILEQYGLEVLLIDARAAKNLPGRKSDVLDCQWHQQLHTFGLLSGCFIPAAEIAPLRSYLRLRDELVKGSTQAIQHHRGNPGRRARWPEVSPTQASMESVNRLLKPS
jgi:hypothetical protein